jgi:putative SOS response-associated peptidase YedK
LRGFEFVCNEVARRIALGIIREDFSQLRIPLVFPEGLPNLSADESIRITDRAAIVRMATEPEMVIRRWSWPGPTGKPVFNYRSEGRRFDSGRCLIPVDAMFEFTSSQDPEKIGKRKDKWRFEAADADWFAIAGLWRADATVGEAFTMLTCEPGADIAPYHNRQVVVLKRTDWAAWLDPETREAAALIAPSAAGCFRVSAAR